MITVCTIAFGDPRYHAEHKRLIASLQADINLLSWTDQYPPGSPTFEQSLYGFKVHAIKEARRQGADHIIWLDPACIVNGLLDYYFTTGLPVLAVKDDTPLVRTISDKALNYYGNPDITGLHLVGGSLYVFDFTNSDCQIIFDHWAKAEADGIFGSMAEATSEKINKHRNDESCMAMSLYLNGYGPVGHDIARYCNGPDSIITKQHWK